MSHYFYKLIRNVNVLVRLSPVIGDSSVKLRPLVQTSHKQLDCSYQFDILCDSFGYRQYILYI